MLFADRGKSVLLFVVLALVAASLVNLGLLPRAVLAFALVFYLPGQMALRLFDAKISPAENMLYSFGLSATMVIGAGFFLGFFDSMKPLPWAVLLGLISIALTWRAPRATLRRIAIPWSLFSRLSIPEALTFACAASLVVGALAIDRWQSAAESQFRYSQFWLIAKDPVEPNNLTIGIENGETIPATYEIDLMMDGQIAARWPEIRLEPRQVWTAPYIGNTKIGVVQRVEAWLFKNGDHTAVYRRVWADIGSPAPGAR